MKKSKSILIIQKSILIIQTFTDKQVQVFNCFVQKNTNKGNKCRDISMYICENFGKWDEEKFFSKIVTTFNLKKSSRLANVFLSLLERHILSMTFEEEKTMLKEEKMKMEVKKKLALLDFYLKKNISRIFGEAFTELKDSLHNYPFRGEFYYRIKYRIIRKSRSLNTRYYLQLNQDYSNNNIFQENINYYYLYLNLKLIASSLNQQIEQSLHFPVDLKIIEYFPVEYVKKENGVYIWYLVVQFLQSKSSFEELYVNLQKNSRILPKVDARNLFTLLENFLKKDSPNFKGITRYKKLIYLYDLQLKKGIIQETQTLVPALFNNIITVALKLKDEKEKDYIQWTEDFLQENYENLVIGNSKQEQKLKAIIKPYNKARCLWTRKKFKEAFEILSLIIDQDNKGLDALQKLRVDRLLLQICYELEEVEELEKSITKLRTYISRNKEGLGEVIVNAHLKMIEICKQLLAIQEKMSYTYSYQIDENKMKKMKKEINEAKDLYEREWLLEKWEEINKQI